MKAKLQKLFKRLFAAAVLLLVGVGLWTLLSPGEEAPAYRTGTITRGSIAEVVTANGTLNPIELVTLGTQVSGQIEKIYVEVNDEVKKGQLLAEIEPKLLQSQLNQSRASLETARTAFEQAQRDLDRTKMLVEKDYVAKVELERAHQSFLAARNNYHSVQAAVERDETNLGYTKITSPIDGVVISQEVTPGQTMAANFQTPNLFKIAGDLTKMKIDVSFSESDISRIKKEMPVKFTVDAFPEREFEGVVQTVNLNPNNQSGVVTYTVVVTVNNKDKVLLPGMTAYVTVTLSEVKDVLRVPAAALRFTPPQAKGGGLQNLLSGGGMRRVSFRTNRGGNAEMPAIYLLKNGEPVETRVKTGATDETYIEVSGEGIKEGDTVITGLMPPGRR